jgi:L-fuconolactonase
VVIDAHTHVACADTVRYPHRPTGVGSDWWRAGGDGEALRAVLDASGVDQAVVVQAVGVYGYDCRCARAVVASSPDRFALVEALDMGKMDLAALSPRASGVRLFGVTGDRPTWLTDGRAADAWDAAAELGLVVVLTLFAEHLAALPALVERRPEVPIALCHCAFPDLAGPEGEAALFGLSDLAAVHLKVTSHNLEASPGLLDRVAEAFGARRLCWGSDYPQHRSLSYPEMVGLARQATAGWADDDRELFLAGTSRRLWLA